MKATATPRPPVCVRLADATTDAIDHAAKCHGWTRTTWLRRQIARGLAEDREVYGMELDAAYEHHLAYQRDYNATRRAPRS